MEEEEKVETLRRIVESIGDSALGEDFSRFVNRCEEVTLDAFLEAVDQSDYSARDWVEALLEFDRYLPTEALRNFPHLLGYLHCCLWLIPSTESRPKFIHLLRKCLQDYGYEGITT